MITILFLIVLILAGVVVFIRESLSYDIKSYKMIYKVLYITTVVLLVIAWILFIYHIISGV